ncbi:MAG: DUF2520 domain-containing protein [Flavobacteriales bacterium]|nr:MAG: DUF2520 domain-containing protein [Flavobacteriales bacterium]
MHSVLLIGTGRLAFHLGHALRGAGYTIVGLAGRDATKTAELAKDLGCSEFGLNDALPHADLRILAVSDDAIHPVAETLPPDGTPTIHLSGSKPVDLLQPHEHRGVLWPIQSFSPGMPISFQKVPLIVDADDEATLGLLRELAERLSTTVVHLPFPLRQHLHLSAVIASNFPTFLLREAERLLTAHKIAPDLLHPLWKATTEKALQGADNAVTGPARRGDIKTIAQQMDLLADEPELRRAYAALSDLIIHTYHPESRDLQDL